MAVKYSRQREVIKDFLCTRKDHPTADMVYMNVRQQYPNISLGTVYRNLTLLTERGEIQKISVGDGVDHFDADTSPHNHFICMGCGSVIDLEMESIEHISESARQNFNGRIDGHVTYFYGLCGDCCKSNLS
ncbi:Fur family peroxide stress response transcriptional regulator [Kineothrix alysoides]|jgi:Fur family peroxide stress response transcriptional regulator|uniref:Fur family peroxide stress response transcriptional regulator n=1 Tax=Kineothrix alysoides TaxID=1469948 RepID=A0A4R1QUG5_9FIRM|nr:transcriptional repressor [Kineothrix alysoides]TCL57147.1 Fur family peroxide stress response transcriptional regulator [Kineothrix alysoides]